MNQTVETTSPIADRARQFAPVVWLIGKVQSGKSSIVRVLTQSTEAEVGSGFRACTKMARVFDFPQDAPIIRFLDTRGLGEVTYDPAEDIAFCEGRSHLILAVVKAMDQQQQVVLDTIAAARRTHPDWPLVVAQTSLHEGYPQGVGHVLP
jgi:predicted GTPase